MHILLSLNIVNLPIDIIVEYAIIILVKGTTPRQKTAARLGQQADGRKEVQGMRYQNGYWYYRGKRYATLKEALKAVWPKG